MTLMRTGGQSGSGSSSGNNTGNQKRRNNSPMGVPVLVWVINALSWALSMATPAPRLFADHRKPSGLNGFIETHWMWFH